ncbi:MAG: DUF4843 domain-containing protein [Marinifilaceae bacterium]
MKQLKYILIASFIAIFVSCSENETIRYSEKPSLYFAEYNDKADSLVYSFQMKQQSVDTLKIQVKLLGLFQDEDKEIELRVNDELTTAVEGRDYVTIENIKMKAKSGVVTLPIVVMSSPDMDNGYLQICVELHQNDNFDVAYENKRKVRVQLTNQLVRPSYWDMPLSLYFGDYSKQKHSDAIRIMGHDFPLRENDLGIKGFDYYMAKGRELCYYYATNQVYDETGNLIVVWDPF